jgi:hypothetical protein
VEVQNVHINKMEQAVGRTELMSLEERKEIANYTKS